MKYNAIAAALLVAPILYPTSQAAWAADMGGDCCADLEERVAELEATVAKKGNRKVSVKVYGQINSAITHYDGDLDVVLDPQGKIGGPVKFSDSDSNTSVIDNGFSESKFGFRGEAKINQDWAAGYVLEFGLGNALNNGTDIEIREANWYLTNSQLGRLSVGRGSTATDDITHISVANTDAVTGTFKIGGVFQDDPNALDGFQANRVRYDTPSIAGFVLSGAWADEDNYDLALRYAGEFQQVRVAAGAGWRRQVVGILPNASFTDLKDADIDVLSGSVSIMHVPTGLFLNGAYGQSEVDTSETYLGVVNVNVESELKAWHLLGGIESKINTLGKTTFYGEYGSGDFDANLGIAMAPMRANIGLDVEGDVWGLGVVQAIDAAAMDLYIAFRHYDVDAGLGVWATNGVNSASLNLVDADLEVKTFTAGGRIKF